MVITILVAIGSSFYFVIMLHSIVDCVMALITAVLFVVVFTRLREALDPVVRGPFSTSASAGAAAASARRSSTTGGGGGGTSGFYGGQRRRLASASSAGGRGAGAGGRMTSPRTSAGAGVGPRFSPRKDVGGGGGRVGERRLLGVAPYGGGSPLGGWGAAAPPVPHTWTAGPRGPGERLLPTPPAPAEPFDPQQLLAEDEGGVGPASAPTHLPPGAGAGQGGGGGRRGSGYQVHGARGRSRSSNASPGGPKLQRVRYGSIGGSGSRDAGALAISYEQQQEEEELRQTNARADKYCRIWGVAIVIIFGQVTHSVTLMYQTWVFAQTTDRSVPRDWWWLLIFIIYLTNEIIVTSGVLYFLRASPPKEPAKERLLGNNSNRRRSSTGASVGMGAGPGAGGAAGRSWIGSGSSSTTAGGGSGAGSLRKVPYASSSSSSRRRSSESSPLRQPALWEESRAAGAGRLPGSADRQGADGEQQQQLPALDLSSGSPGRGSGRGDFSGRRGGVARQGALLEDENEDDGPPSESDSGQDLLESDSEGSDRAGAIARAAARAGSGSGSGTGSGSRQRGMEAGGRSQSQSGSEGSRSLGSLSLSMSGPGTGPGRSSLGQGGVLGPVRRAPGGESGIVPGSAGAGTGAGAGAGAMAMAQGGRGGGQGVGS